MNALEIINQLKAEHITIALSDNGKLDISGNKEKIGKILPFIRDHKAEIVNILSLEKQEVNSAPKIEDGDFNDDEMFPSPETTHKKAKAIIPPFALKWILEHLQALRQAGWTGRELFRRNKTKGICWRQLWDAPFLKVYLHDNGVIEFECVIEGRDIIQSARPMHRARTIIH